VKWAILAITKGGLSLGSRIRASMPQADLFTIPRWASGETRTIEGSLRDFVGTIFGSYDVLLFIMAAGIVVRVIAESIRDKFSDPAVLVMDEKGSSVISLLSGHWGGANEAARFLAGLVGARPVITTASDVGETLSVDMLAKSLGFEIDDPEGAKRVTALIVNGEPVGIWSLHTLSLQLPSNVHVLEDGKDEGMSGSIFVGNLRRESRNPHVHLVPRNIIIGLGCRRGVPQEVIAGRIEGVLRGLGIHAKSLKCLAIPDIKEGEKGIEGAILKLSTEIRVIPRQRIKEVEHLFRSSEFVRRAAGVGAICEPCAYLAAEGSGRFLMMKDKGKGVSLALWEVAM
jgi:cobalt-precorrin 5A hydrolase